MRNANDRPCSPVSDRNADKIVLMYFTISTENRSSLNANQNENEMPGNQFANNSAVTSKDEIIPKVELHDQATGNENATTFTVKCRHGNCNDLFESNGAVMLHMRSYHAKVKKTYNCHLCKKTLSSRVGIKRHMNAIHMGECFRCSYRTCLKVFKREDVLTEHVKNVHIQELKCPKCSRKFSRNVNMKRHMARRHFKNRGKTKAKRFKKSASKSNLNWFLNENVERGGGRNNNTRWDHLRFPRMHNIFRCKSNIFLLEQCIVNSMKRKTQFNVNSASSFVILYKVKKNCKFLSTSSYEQTIARNCV